MKQISTPNGKKLPIRYGWGALSDFSDSTDKSLDEILHSFDPKRLKPREFTEFVYFGIKDGCEESNIDFPFDSIKEVEKIINVMGLTKVLRESLAAFQESPFMETKEEEDEKVEPKKK